MNQNILKVCIWMNIPSHHQDAFFSSLFHSPNTDIIVIYYDDISTERKNLGWNLNYNLKSYEFFKKQNVKETILMISDWKDRIHIIPGFSNPFLKELLEEIILNKVRWVHWSERSGRELYRMLNYNKYLVNLFLPIFYKIKGYYNYADMVNKHALGAFAQGKLAKRDFIKWGIDKNKIEYLFYTINGLKKNKNSHVNNHITFTYLGSLTKNKGIDLLIKAFCEISKERKCKLLLVGPDNNGFKKLAERFGIENKTKFTGPVLFNKINYYLNQTDIFVLPTRHDGWGVVLNEAASLGIPIISTDECGAAYHLIKDGINGFRIKTGSVHALAKAMSFYLNNQKAIAEHGKKSFKLFQKYIPEKTVTHFRKTILNWLDNAHHN